MKKCGNCGTDNSDENKFCIKCGSSLYVQPANTPASAPTESKTSNKGTAAVLLNFFILWGLGYWYLGVKKVFGLPWYSLAIIEIFLYAIYADGTAGISGLILLVIVVLNFALAYDIYQKGSGKDGWVSYQR